MIYVGERDMKLRHILILASLMQLVACGGLPVGWSGDDPGAGTTAPTVGQPAAPAAVEPAQSDSAVDQLLGEAMQRRSEGDIEGAISLSERALRIDPRSPRVYYVLGVLQYDKGEVASALQLARKARTLDTGRHYEDSIDRLIVNCEAAIDTSDAAW